MFEIEEFQATLEKATRILDRHHVRFHLTGGITSVAYSETRLTQDVDLVLDPQAVGERIDSLCGEFEAEGFLVERDSMRQALDSNGMFQIFDNDEALKLDLYVRELIPGELSRSVLVELFEGVTLPIASRTEAIHA